MVPGDTVSSGPRAGIKVGNSLPLSAIPIGTALHNVEMNPGKGGQLARSAGTAARLVSKGMCSDMLQCMLKPVLTNSVLLAITSVALLAQQNVCIWLVTLLSCLKLSWLAIIFATRCMQMRTMLW